MGKLRHADAAFLCSVRAVARNCGRCTRCLVLRVLLLRDRAHGHHHQYTLSEISVNHRHGEWTWNRGDRKEDMTQKS